jgi:CheY-like chemotaxis protein
MNVRQKTILVVDDDCGIRHLMRHVLNHAHYSVQEAEDGVVALTKLDADRPDLVLLDLMMPGLNGWGVLEHVERMADPPPVVLISGSAEVLPPGHLNQHVTGYVCKPFEVSQLLAACTAALTKATVVHAAGARKEARRTFHVEATLLSLAGVPLTRGQLIQVSPGGFRAEMPVGLRPGDLIRIGFRLPPRKDPVRVTGRVRWQTETTLGAQIEDVSPEDAALLGELTDCDEPGPEVTSIQ